MMVVLCSQNDDIALNYPAAELRGILSIEYTVHKAIQGHETFLIPIVILVY